MASSASRSGRATRGQVASAGVARRSQPVGEGAGRGARILGLGYRAYHDHPARTAGDRLVQPGEVLDAADLMNKIANSKAAQHKYAERMVAFGYARDPNQMDACTVDAIAANIANTRYPVRNLLVDLTQADSFTLRLQEEP